MVTDWVSGKGVGWVAVVVGGEWVSGFWGGGGVGCGGGQQSVVGVG